VLDILLSARERQAAKEQETGPGGHPGDGNPPARPGREASQSHGLVTGPLSEPDTTPMPLTWGNAYREYSPHGISTGQSMIICVRGGIDPVSPHCL
jgi:hypothetical protein